MKDVGKKVAEVSKAMEKEVPAGKEVKKLFTEMKKIITQKRRASKFCRRKSKSRFRPGVLGFKRDRRAVFRA